MPKSSSIDCIDELAVSLARVRSQADRIAIAPVRSFRRASQDVQKLPFDSADRLVEHTDTLQELRIANLQVFAQGPQRGGGGPDGAPDPYYQPG